MLAWFAEADLKQAPPPAQRLIAEICRLLDRLNPANLAVERQTATTERGQVLIRLIHTSKQNADLDIEVGDCVTHIYGLYGHDEDYAAPDDPEEVWLTDTINTVGNLPAADGSRPPHRRTRPLA